MNIRQFFERYGVSLAVVVALALVVALVPGNAPDDRVATGTNRASTASSGAAGGATTGTGSAGVGTSGGGFGGGGSAAGTATVSGGEGSTATGAPGDVVFGQGPSCRADGRQIGIGHYMPPCVDWTGTNNGGATAQGVSADQVLVVRYLPQIDSGTQAILESSDLADDPDTIARAYDAIRVYFNQHYETYGREVVFQDYVASGPNESDEAMKADAVRIAEDIKPFAVIEGNPAAPMAVVLIRELSLRGILCMCATSLSSAFYNELPPNIFSSLPTIDEYATHTAEYISKKMLGKNADRAGDLATRNKQRVFGLIYLEGARGKPEPELARSKQVMSETLAQYGIQPAVEIGYIYDPGRNQLDVANLIATLKSKGVTTVIPMWDPLYPILITTEATAQLYFPEWFVVGTGLSDTTTAGRLYNQPQWRNAFGISPLWITWQTVNKSGGYRIYHHSRPQDPPGAEGVLVNVYVARIQTFFRGVHMAGPNLTPESFAAGQYAYPRTGGGPQTPLVYVTRQAPTEVKDFVEIFWDAGARGPDERGRMGSGMVMKVNGGLRYEIGEWTADPPSTANGVAVSDADLGGPHEEDGHTHTTRCLHCPS